MHPSPSTRVTWTRLPRWLLPLLALVLVATLLGLPRNASSAPALWTQLIGTSETDVANSVGLDADGNLYVVGDTSGTLFGPNGGSSNYVQAYLRKYDSAGALQWTRDLGRKASFEVVYAHDVALDAAGAIYVVGSTNIAADGTLTIGQSYGYLRTYDSAGTLQWTRTFGTAGQTGASSIAADGSGNLYLTGYVNGSLEGQAAAGGLDVFLRAYTSDGDHQWTRQLGAADSDLSGGVAVDRAGQVYVAGLISGAIDGQGYAGGYADAFVGKYSPDGTRQWLRLLGGDMGDEASSVAVGPDDAISVVGQTQRSLDGQPHVGERDLFVSRYSADGTRQWTRQLGSAGNDVAGDVGLDADGNLYVVGSTPGTLAGQASAGGFDLLVGKYAPSGKGLWTLVYGSDQNDEGRGLALGGQGQLYLVGRTDGQLGSQPKPGGPDGFLSRVINPTLTPRSFLPLAPR